MDQDSESGSGIRIQKTPESGSEILESGMIYSGSGSAFLESRIQIWILPLLLKADLEIVKKEL